MTRQPHFSDRTMLMTLRRLSQGESTISKHTYDWRKRAGDPSIALYERRFGSWNQALKQAGLEFVEQPLQLQGARPCWSDAVMLDAIRAAHAATGSTALRAYELWRAGHDRGIREQRIPAATSIRYRFGQWSTATRIAMAGKKLSANRRPA